MSATSVSTTPLPSTGRTKGSAAPAIPLPRLVGVELRKSVDTRAGLWLLISITLVALVIVAIALGTSEPSGRRFAEFFRLVQIPVGLLLPVLGILAIAGEISSRSILQSATLTPRRGRILVAKVLALLVLTAVVVLAGAVLSALATGVGVALGGTRDPWSIELSLVGGVVLFQVLYTLSGFALGLLLLSSPLAIVLFFVAPTVIQLVGQLVSSLTGPLSWIDLNTTFSRLVAVDQVAITGEQWGQIATSAAFWIALPMVLGVVRFHRREIA